MLFTAYCHVIR
jgi:hypothetical protein